MEALLVRPNSGVTPADPGAETAPAGTLREQNRGSAGCTGAVDFVGGYAQEFPGLVWFLMSQGASAHEAADVAQTAFTEAFPVWPTIRCPRAWLRQVAGRIYHRQLNRAETPVESLPDRQGPLSAAAATELRDEARTVLAALASLPPKQREVMAWHLDGFGSAEIAATLRIDPAAVRQNLIKARRNLKKKLGISGAPQ
jgi:RNA polymerase sigma-70 factor (ECF subfamily)